MLAAAKSQIGATGSDREIAIGALLDMLAGHAEKPLVFEYDGRPVKPGYHVTEVKAGRFEALDCGANPESWSEIFIQLWDVIDGDKTHMKAGKFAAIIRKVSDHVALEPAARLTFEVSDGARPMQLHRASAPRLLDGVVRVALSPRPASCKPRDRWLESQQADTGACCAPRAEQPCCARAPAPALAQG